MRHSSFNTSSEYYYHNIPAHRQVTQTVFWDFSKIPVYLNHVIKNDKRKKGSETKPEICLYTCTSATDEKTRYKIRYREYLK